MQVETRLIQTWTPHRGASIGRPAGPREPLGAPWKELTLKAARSNTGWDKPAFARHVEQEDLGEVQYFGKPYNFNTKYVVDCEADDVIGSRLTLASGKTVWVDMSAESVLTACNRR